MATDEEKEQKRLLHLKGVDRSLRTCDLQDKSLSSSRGEKTIIWEVKAWDDAGAKAFANLQDALKEQREKSIEDEITAFGNICPASSRRTLGGRHSTDIIRP